MKIFPLKSPLALSLAALLALAGCLSPLAEPNDGGPEVSALFEVSPVNDTVQWTPDTGADLVADAVADTADVSATEDAVVLPDSATGDSALPDDATASDIADDGTATTLPDAVTGADVINTCGDGKCSKADKENCKVCPDDCGDCPSICDDGTCQSDETCTDCPADCGSCTPVCSLFDSSGCQATEQCYPDGKANLCSAPGTLSVGDACIYFNACQKGQLCVGGLCRVICDYTGTNTQSLCEPGVTCGKVNVSGPAAAGLGVCLP